MQLRRAVASDASLLLELIKELAVYEKMLDQVETTTDDLVKYVFEKNFAEVVFIMEDDKEVGFGLYFFNFSTFVGKPGIYLEDLYIKPDYRKKGYGKKFFSYLVDLARLKGYGRIEWSCLNWNQPSIDFYHSLNAKALSEWTVYRLDKKTIWEFNCEKNR